MKFEPGKKHLFLDTSSTNIDTLVPLQNRKRRVQQFFCLRLYSLPSERVYRTVALATAVSSGSTIPDFSR
jgi:hypothetical protein